MGWPGTLLAVLAVLLPVFVTMIIAPQLVDFLRGGSSSGSLSGKAGLTILPRGARHDGGRDACSRLYLALAAYPPTARGWCGSCLVAPPVLGDFVDGFAALVLAALIRRIVRQR